MDAFDVEGVCFSQFSINDWLSGRARKYLEDMIVAAGDDHIDACTIITAFCHAESIIFRNLPPEEQEKRFAVAWAERAKRNIARGHYCSPLPPFRLNKKPKPPDIWDGFGEEKAGKPSASSLDTWAF